MCLLLTLFFLFFSLDLRHYCSFSLIIIWFLAWEHSFSLFFIMINLRDKFFITSIWNIGLWSLRGLFEILILTRFYLLKISLLFKVFVIILCFKWELGMIFSCCPLHLSTIWYSQECRNFLLLILAIAFNMIGAGWLYSRKGFLKMRTVILLTNRPLLINS
jgi:hypothetical protein